MGQRAEVCGAGGGTVRMRRPEVEEMGGEGLVDTGGDAGDEGELERRVACCGVGEERDTVFVGGLGP